MQKEYQELLETLEKAQAKARAIQQKGGPTERVYRGLVEPIRQVRERIRFMKDVAERGKAAQKAAKAAPQLPDGPCPTPTPEQLADPAFNKAAEAQSR